MKKPRGRASKIQKEIQQSRPFRSRHQEAGVSLLRTADVVRRRVSRVIEAAGITFQQYNVLRILRGSGDQGIPTLEIARRMIEETPGITRLLDRLEAKKLVRRERCPSDRRQVLCWIAPDGAGLLARLDEPVDRMDAEAMGALRDEEIGHLIALLDRVREGGGF